MTVLASIVAVCVRVLACVPVYGSQSDRLQHVVVTVRGSGTRIALQVQGPEGKEPRDVSLSMKR